MLAFPVTTGSHDVGGLADARARRATEIKICVELVAGQGASVCDKLQCVCDKTTAECMAAARFNHSLTAHQCSGPAPSCRRASRPPKPHLSPQSSEETKVEDTPTPDHNR